MKNLCFVFQLHAPYRLKRYRFFEIGQDHYYYDDFQTEERIQQLASQSYQPANKTILEMIKSSNGKFRCAYSISGIVLELLEQYAPEVIDSFKELAATKAVEFLATPYAYSLAAAYDSHEFERQLKLHAEKVKTLFDVEPTAVWNTELMYSDEIADTVAKMGYKTILTEGARHILGWKSPNYVYNSAASSKLKVLMRNPKLSDDIAFRFSDYSWKDYPLDAEKYVGWLADLPEEEPLVNIWMGYEALGMRQHPTTGIFEFLKAVPYFAMERGIGFLTPSEATKKIAASDTIVAPYPISWSGEAKDLSAYNGNDLQQEALNKLFAVSERVNLCQSQLLKRDWQILQSDDHFHYMNHIDAGWTNYESAYEAFINYMNVLADFLQLVDEQYPTTIENEELNELLKTINNLEKENTALEAELKKAKKAKK